MSNPESIPKSSPFLPTDPRDAIRQLATIRDVPWHFVPLRRDGNTKLPAKRKWNGPALVSIQDAARLRQYWACPRPFGLGVHLANSGLVSVDVDMAREAVIAARAVGIDLPAVLRSGWRIHSRKGHGRSLFRAPPDAGTWLRHRAFRIPGGLNAAGKPICKVVFELRGGSLNLQDVLPPTIHPNTGEPYWADPLPRSLPVLPPEVAALWRGFDTAAATMLAALDVPKADRALAMPGTKKHLRFRIAQRDAMALFNATHDAADLLAEAGYTEDGRGRFQSPGSENGAGIGRVPGADGLWFCHHGSDPLAEIFDAWAAVVVLRHGGDADAAWAAYRLEFFTAIGLGPIPAATEGVTRHAC